ncbi:MmcQ/YjbR family DNA-binding protein, partial [Bacillus velezensis]|uniref:MmcQ/YjbR family DNA-binding protein n=1 Tax=Bacillus velezensis TaxID=492670 RepID=UPI0035D996A4
MNYDAIKDYCLTFPNSYEDHPFGDGWTAIRHKGNKKILPFASTRDEHSYVNLTCEPERADFLRA